MRWCVFVVALSACASDSFDDNADAKQCTRLREHIVQLQVADIQLGTGIDREAHRAALARSLGDRFVTTCSGKLTVSQVDCALAATSSAAATTCVR